MTAATERVGVARASVPSPWFLLLFAAVPFGLILFGPAGASARITQRLDPTTGRWVDITPMHPMAPYAWMLVCLGLALWVYWVFRAHRALDPGATTGKTAQVTALLNLVPLYNLVWVCTWPATLMRSRVGPDMPVPTAAIRTLGCIGLICLTLSVLPPGAVLLASVGLALLTVSVGLLARQLNLKGA